MSIDFRPGYFDLSPPGALTYIVCDWRLSFLSFFAFGAVGLVGLGEMARFYDTHLVYEEPYIYI